MSKVQRPRRSRDELRALLMDVGQSILLEEGLGARADTLTFKRAFERIRADTGVGLTNASVIGGSGRTRPTTRPMSWSRWRRTGAGPR